MGSNTPLGTANYYLRIVIYYRILMPRDVVEALLLETRAAHRLVRREGRPVELALANVREEAHLARARRHRAAAGREEGLIKRDDRPPDRAPRIARRAVAHELLPQRRVDPVGPDEQVEVLAQRLGVLTLKASGDAAAGMRKSKLRRRTILLSSLPRP